MRRNLIIFNKIFLLIIWLVVYLCSIVIINKIDQSSFEVSTLSFVLDWLGIVLLIYVLYSWKSKTGRIFTPYIIFFIFFFLFNFGQPLMWAFGIHIPNEIGGNGNINSIEIGIVKTQIYTILMMLSFHIGALFIQDKINIKSRLKPKDVKKCILFIGILLGIISIPLTFYRAINFYIIASQFGYRALYYSDYVQQGGFLMIIEIFFMPSLVCILIGSGFNKTIRKCVYVIFILYLAINLLSGDRGSWIYKLLVFLWLHSIYVKPLDYKKILKYGILGIVGLYIVTIIVSVRNIGLHMINQEYIMEYLLGSRSPIISNIFEMGGTMEILHKLITDDGVRTAWIYGNTYLTAIAGMISTRFLSFIGINFVLVDDWFSQDYLGITWGTGFSMIGEAYLNAGLYLAPIVIILLGYLIGKILYVNPNINPNQMPLKYVFISTSLSTIIGLSRGTIYLYLKTWFYGTIVTCIFILFLYYVTYKKKCP